MADEEALNILREIRDLQKTHIELYKNALSNQQAAIEMQRNAASKILGGDIGYYCACLRGPCCRRIDDSALSLGPGIAPLSPAS